MDPRPGAHRGALAPERGWRPRERVEVYYGVYCRPGDVCIAIAYFAHVRTDRRGRFMFRARAGEELAGDRDRKIVSGSGFTFSQRTVTRRPHYRVILPECGDCG